MVKHTQTVVCKRNLMKFRGEWPSGLRPCGKNRKVPGSNPLGARPGLGTQPRYEACRDLRVENV